ncbi:MAG: hydantoinase B/oxoprolinase family protein, partial [Alphaproteobacteria bacterium]|nr:hydantoinase B/oxoprolinase family protein [Alphaproteobacteria bacterium]
MPPFSRRIEEEGVRLHDVLLVRDGAFREAELTALLSAGPHPVRGIPERLADLQAQIAANALGVRLLQDMVARYGAEAVAAYMGHVQDDAGAAMREAIAALPDGEHRFVDHLDDGARIAVRIEITGERARVDFTGTDALLPGNLNAPRAVVLAAVLYVFRTLIRRAVPLNQGCFQPLE